MRKGTLYILALWLVGSARLFAQAPPPSKAEPPDAKEPAPAIAETTVVPMSTVVDTSDGFRIWARADYILWWVKSAPLPVPLVTTGDPNVGFDPTLVNTVNTAGAIGEPGTRVLLGNSPLAFPALSGVRATAGTWIDEDQRFGAEASGFVLQRQSNTFAAGSDSSGNPPLYFPIFSAIAGTERAVPIADPLRKFSGDVSVTSALQLWGAEANILYTFFSDRGIELGLLAGFRYADLRESLHINNTTTDLLFGNVTVLNDSFSTANQFYGGQIGGRLGMRFERLSLDVTGKIAAGSTRQTVDIEGDITQLGPNPLVPPGLGTFPGGVFTQPSNIGKQRTSEFTDPFAVLPALEVKLGYDLTPHIRVFGGYELMYWTRVVRPGDQINHTVNLTQNAVLDPNGTGTLVGPAQPATLFGRSDFWAQGINFGVEVRY